MIDRRTVQGFLLGATFAIGASLALYVGVAGAQTGANQPRMQAALAALVTAKNELLAGASNKGGHRLKAIDFVNSAIVEVQAGMAVAN